MAVLNPAHAAVVKITDPYGDAQYLHHLHGWHCTFSWVHLCSGISEKQIKALKFALDQCHHPNQVLDAVKRYGSPKFTYELDGPPAGFNPTGAKPGDGKPAPADAVILMGPDGEGLVYAPVPQAFSLQARLDTILAEARDNGYAVVAVSPYELQGVDREEMEQHMRRQGGLFIDDNREDDEEE